MLKCKNQKEELQKYVDEHADYFQELDVDTAQAYSVFLHSKKLLKKMLPENEKKEGKVNMCKALEDLYQDGINQGISQGISQGIKQGISQGISQGIQTNRQETIRRMLSKKKYTYEEIGELNGVAVETVKKIENQFC